MQSAQTEGCVSAQTWRERIGRLVRVELVDGTALEGTLYTIDPGSQDIALLVEENPTGSESKVVGVRIVFGHSIESIRLVGETFSELAEIQDEQFQLFSDYKGSYEINTQVEPYSEEEAGARQARVRDLLQQHRIPFTEETEPSLEARETSSTLTPCRHCFHVVGGLSLAWPYTPASCRCTNEIVLFNITSLLAK
mmetsp:Transcript_42015/g.70104  ORF Transcript_42015/g.70104 Transcript_42015/m.70104 type:complete len:195 (+) Transcript_42015:182-766(+)|eukprot:CAMPEP_0198202096 /NCGR_PEP_ID=MMETSP1445-20131203/5172_1 /TAXON_ID=36898 /ORGANISM="Pyramimonas sp., Strain CCMP2087" /LENGTH=194 /DNA_ID=CAMNT_0043872827 /DNA_START=181 /DNA_END=765 /DNA_ORIENTATION=-